MTRLRFQWVARLMALSLLFATMSVGPVAAQEVTAQVFWQAGCPYCKQARATLADMAATDPEFVLDEIELGRSEADNALFVAVVAHFGIKSPSVPLVIIGAQYAVGFTAGGRSAVLYAEMLEQCLAGPCPDLLAEMSGDRVGRDPPTPAAPTPPPDRINVPFAGEIGLHDLPLPLLTVVLAGVDGFNPCAMWVLALLIGLLLGVDDTRRMWTLGAVFLLATGAMYFAVMAAWLNVVLWIGAVGWLRIAIGFLAIGAGVYYLREYWVNPEGVCRVTPSHGRATISDAFRRVVEQPSLLLAALGVTVLAVAVNLIELVCSAGVPAVYTQVLALQDLSQAAHYGYLALYLAVFLLDDAILFVVAMVTLRAAVTSGRYSRLSHLVGGVVLLALGAVMVLRPDLLA